MRARMLHRFGHRLLGDGVEHHPLDRLAVERLLLLEHLEHVPGDRLTLAVGVGRQNELVGALGCLRDVVEPLLRLGIDLPNHAEIGIGIDRAALGGKVAHMAERRQNLIATTKILVDRLRLGGRFHDYQIHINPMICWPFLVSRRGRDALRPPGTWVMQPRLSNRYRRAQGWPGPRKRCQTWQINAATILISGLRACVLWL